MSTAFWLILTATIQVTLLSCIALLVNKFGLRNQPKEAARLLAFSSLLMLILTFAIVLPLPSWFWGMESADQNNANATTTSQRDLASTTEFQTALGEENGTAETPTSLPALTALERVQSFSQQLESGETTSGSSSLIFLIKAIRWVGVSIGVLFLLGTIRFVISLIAIKRLKSGSEKVNSPSIIRMTESLCEAIGCKRKIEVHHSKNLSTAAAMGAVTPDIFLARDFEQWRPADQKAVLAHEIAHIHHRDFEANLICQVCRLIHFFNPAVQWLTRQMRLQQELAADRTAAAVTCGSVEYSKTLASLALRQDEMTSPIASMFLPQENNFMQRIKMLRNETTDHKTPFRLIAILTVAVAIATCGIRLPANALALPTLQESVDEKKSGFDLSWVGAEGSVLCMRPDQLFKSPLFKGLADKLKMIENIAKQQDKSFEDATGLGSEHVSESITYSASATNIQESFYIYRTFEDNLENFKSLGKVVGQDKRFPIQIERTKSRSQMNYGLILDERSILWAFSKEGIEAARKIGKRTPDRAAWMREFKKVQSKPVVLTIDGAHLKAMSGGVLPMLDAKVTEAILKCKSAVCSINLTRQAEFGLVFEFANSRDAKTLEGMMPEVKKAMSAAFQSLAQSPTKWQQTLGKSALDSVKTAEVKCEGQRLELSTNFKPNLAALKGMAEQVSAAALRTQGMNNMRQLTLGMLNYESAYGALPSATMRSESGHEYSWRIAILPFIEQNELYEKYRFDEPWDSEHNLKLTSEMPELFKHPASDSPTDTNFFAVVGPGTLFPEGGGVKFKDATDGSMRTVILVEAIRDAHWAKPGGIALEDALDPATLGGFTKGVIHMNMLDGSVRSVSNQITPEMLAALYSMAGGEADIALSELALEE